MTPEAHPQTVIEICEQSLAWTHEQASHLNILNSQIAVCGDSAGGNIAAVVAQRAAQKDYAPCAQFLIYPAIDFQQRYPSFQAFKSGLTLTGTDVDVVIDLYATQHDVAFNNPLISPIYGNLEKLAPAYVITVGHDVLRDEGKVYAEKMQKAGNQVVYQEFHDQAHGFINFTAISKRSKACFIEACEKFAEFLQT